MLPFSTWVDPYDVRVCQEAEDSGANYDALVDLLNCIESILKPLRISADIPPNMMVIMKAMKILYRLLLVLARATKLSRQGRLRESTLTDVTRGSTTAGKTREKLLEEEDVKRALRHLNRLTQEEVQMVLIQNMEVVYCLINNIIGVIDGTQNSEMATRAFLLSLYPLRWQGIDR